ncbi:uncharacterized protein L969DRAFT_87850 [Mixia osmundae IAM 14324]|uniref:Uncharacterized protein n=1 Tax=Mixia osmundae (strain CBS 9802 / IAM 14324 / JCM 22182 / KY 12970) TaxID=764103 RepID=G7DYZ2_MIXOS|nr:uncharacterized protein L969DRAFT_87850 [Mixia osmundae IAM 14324]KEI38633.1 hypothetical protein L969DRAFT_87850 [Mixia osmundae IAM 14324]GAA95802.1 hypothetical protein E5Q_02459 [Mixia osmundae IAM 14324]
MQQQTPNSGTTAPVLRKVVHSGPDKPGNTTPNQRPPFVTSRSSANTKARPTGSPGWSSPSAVSSDAGVARVAHTNASALNNAQPKVIKASLSHANTATRPPFYGAQSAPTLRAQTNGPATTQDRPSIVSRATTSLRSTPTQDNRPAGMVKAKSSGGGAINWADATDSPLMARSKSAINSNARIQVGQDAVFTTTRPRSRMSTASSSGGIGGSESARSSPIVNRTPATVFVPSAGTPTVLLPLSSPTRRTAFSPSASAETLLPALPISGASLENDMNGASDELEAWKAKLNEEADAREREREARVHRKILDLEITNASLLAINASLETAKLKQSSEIRNLRRLNSDFALDPSVLASAGLLSPGRHAQHDDFSSHAALAADEPGQSDEEQDLETVMAQDHAYAAIVVKLDMLLRSGRDALAKSAEAGGNKVLTALEIDTSIDDGTPDLSYRQQSLSVDPDESTTSHSASPDVGLFRNRVSVRFNVSTQTDDADWAQSSPSSPSETHPADYTGKSFLFNAIADV